MDTIIGSIIGALGAIIAVVIAHFLKNRAFSIINKGSKVPNFSKTLISISFIQWRDKKAQSEPFIRNKRISHLGKEFLFDIYDESLIYAEWTPSRNIVTDFVREHKTSGLVLLEPVQPQLLVVDESAYHRSNGTNIPVKYKLFRGNSISYITRRFNAYQDENQDFRFTFSDINVDSLLLSLNFEPILGDAAFKESPTAFIHDEYNPTKREYLKLDSWYGRTWNINCNLKNKRGYVKVSWKLCDGKPIGKKYVFGYGSLMYPSSINQTLKDFLNRKTKLIPAKLEGYRRSWSAFGKNRYGAASKDNDTPEYLSFVNIEPDFNSRALGVLFEVSDRELELLDIRESVYVRIDVTHKIEAFDCELSSPTVFTYISIPQLDLPDSNIGIRNDYIDLIKKASQEIDTNNLTLKESYRDDYDELCKEYNKYKIVHPLLSEDKKRYEL